MDVLEEDQREQHNLREKEGRKKAEEDALEQSRAERELMLICGMSGGGGNKWAPIVAAKQQRKAAGDKSKKGKKKDKK